MHNSLQFGFVSILLSLVMYFVFVSIQQSAMALDIGKSAKCGAGSCCIANCEIHSVEIADEQHIRFSGSVLSPEEFANHLIQAHKGCTIAFVHVHAAPSLRHDIVLNMTSRILDVAPHAQISWDSVTR